MTATTHRSTPQSPLSKPRTGTAGFYSQIFHEIQTGKVPLPSLPHLALQLRSAVSDPNSGFETISRIIQTDPGVASYLLKLANSPAFAARHKAGDLASAINRMGTGKSGAVGEFQEIGRNAGVRLNDSRDCFKTRVR
ncbi:MAG: HDOD domain-containing protein, partial [Pseudomonadota bacterium]